MAHADGRIGVIQIALRATSWTERKLGVIETSPEPRRPETVAVGVTRDRVVDLSGHEDDARGTTFTAQGRSAVSFDMATTFTTFPPHRWYLHSLIAIRLDEDLES